MAKAKTEHYVNNKEFLEALIEYREKVAIAASKDLPKPRISNYIGSCFLKIATHLSYKSNFVNYMYREDMISDGIENCVQYIHNFDPAKSKNPFAYFTQISYFAFLRRIQREKRQLDIKTKIVEKSGFLNNRVLETVPLPEPATPLSHHFQQFPLLHSHHQYRL